MSSLGPMFPDDGERPEWLPGHWRYHTHVRLMISGPTTLHTIDRPPVAPLFDESDPERLWLSIQWADDPDAEKDARDEVERVDGDLRLNGDSP